MPVIFVPRTLPGDLSPSTALAGREKKPPFVGGVWIPLSLEVVFKQGLKAMMQGKEDQKWMGPLGDAEDGGTYSGESAIPSLCP